MYIPLACVIWNLLTTTLISGYDDLSAHRSAIQYKTYLACPTCVANNAVDRNITTCTRTDMGPTSAVQYTWWNVDLGAVQSVHNIRIQFRDYRQYAMRQKGRFAGFSLYVSNTTDRNIGYLCYKDGPELPPLDFNTNCTVHGRYIIFYNERLTGTQYPLGYEPANIITELCEVTVTGCYTLNVFGCQKPCPVNCEESRCDATNGTCIIGCTPGWVGEYCQTACPAGYYGLKCESECIGVCKDKEPCNHTNGLCDKGCDDGWTGTNCIEACPPKSYGPNCIYTCGHCSGDIPCNRTDGKCNRGCKPGYTGELCDTECSTGTFGSNCIFSCNGYCSDDITCNKTTGRCDTGCKPGYTGELCDTDVFKGGEPEVGSSVFKNDCNESFYIAGLSILTIATILISIICLLFIRKYRRLAKKMRSLQYTCITKTSPRQGNNTIDGQHYEEMRVSESSYHNIELKN